MATATQTPEISADDITYVIAVKDAVLGGRKFEAADLYNGGATGTDMYEIACQWARTQVDADFEWLRKVARAEAKGKPGTCGLTDKAAAGVLNCLVAAQNRAARQPAPQPSAAPQERDQDERAADAYEAWARAQEEAAARAYEEYRAGQVQQGFYTVVDGGEHRTFKIGPWREDSYRPTKAHEYVFLLTKHDRYFYDAEAAKEDSVRAGDIPGGGKGFIDYTTGGHNRDGLAAMSQRPVAPTRNLRTVWTIATKPFKGAHFATFPPELAQRCIVAGTSAKGQCPACGAPWERVTARGALAGEARIQDTERPAAEAKGLSGTSILRTNGRTWRETIDLGWQPTCTCDGEFVAEPLVPEEPERTWRRFVPGPGGVQEPVPQVVLDPFGGAGTTGLVASRLGRDAVLIELNPEYAAMARQRIEADAPMFSEVS